MRPGVLITAAILSTGCGGEGGIKISGPVASLTSTEACLFAGGPGAGSGDKTCYRIEESGEIQPGLSEGDLVTLRASDEVVVELTRVGRPE